jgi:hypothetical protein
VALDPSDRSSPRYAEWTLRVPGDPSSVVLVASLVNRMKAGLREDEFMAMVRALADRFERDRPSPRPFDEGAFPERPIAASSQV